MLLNCLFLFLIHLKLELLTQIPTLIDEIYVDLVIIWKFELFD